MLFIDILKEQGKNKKDCLLYLIDLVVKEHIGLDITCVKN